MPNAITNKHGYDSVGMEESMKHIYHYCAKNGIKNGVNQEVDGLLFLDKPIENMAEYQNAKENAKEDFLEGDVIIFSSLTKIN